MNHYTFSETIAQNVAYILDGFVTPAKRRGDLEVVFTANNINTNWTATKREIMEYLEFTFSEMGYRVSRVVDWSPAYRMDIITISW